MDDLTLSGNLDTVEKDLFAMQQVAAETSLYLKWTKCEITTEDFLKWMQWVPDRWSWALESMLHELNPVEVSDERNVPECRITQCRISTTSFLS